MDLFLEKYNYAAIDKVIVITQVAIDFSGRPWLVWETISIL